MTPWTVASQAPLTMGFSRQGYWSGLPFPSPGDLPDPGMEPASSRIAGRFLMTEPPAAAAAAKSLQLCPTLCDPIDYSLPGFSIHGIFQARVLEWGAIAFSVTYIRMAINNNNNKKKKTENNQIW